MVLRQLGSGAGPFPTAITAGTCRTKQSHPQQGARESWTSPGSGFENSTH